MTPNSDSPPYWRWRPPDIAHADGTAYVREPEVDHQIRQLCALPVWKRKLELRRHGYLENLKAESLVFACRESFREGDDAMGWGLAQTIVHRIRHHIANQMRRSGVLEHQVDDAVAEFVHWLFGVLRDGKPDAAFAEIRVWLMVRRKAKQVGDRWSKLHGRDRLESDLLEPGDEEGMLSRLASPVRVDEIALHRDLLERIPEEHRQMVYLLAVEGLPIESQESGARTVSSVLGVTPRTVRNRMARLRRFLEDDVDER